MLSDVEKIECIKYHVDLENCYIIMDFDVSINRLKKYYKDSFYKDIVSKIIPDLDIFLEEYNVERKSINEDTEINNINYNNIKEIIKLINDRKK